MVRRKSLREIVEKAAKAPKPTKKEWELAVMAFNVGRIIGLEIGSMKMAGRARKEMGLVNLAESLAKVDGETVLKILLEKK